ncbi:MAG: DUF3500 domain-containing protein, partial [Mycobacteriaceae bacterium]
AAAPVIALSLLLFSACSSENTTADPATSSSVAQDNSATGAESATLVAEAVKNATAFLATLDSSAQKSAVFDYTNLSAKENSWSNFPTGIFNNRQGIKLGDLNATQRSAAMAVLNSVLSDQGEKQVTDILAADDYLATLSSGKAGGGPALDFSSDNYYLAFYGEPSSTSPWTIQFGGHHLAVHISIGGGVVSVSPLFTGVEPTSFTVNGIQYAPMVKEADTVFGLLGSLSADQLTQAKLSGSYDDLVMGPGADTDYPSTEGIPYSNLTAEQQNTVLSIMRLWVEDADPALADGLMKTYESQLKDTVIAWAGGTDRNAANAYLRIDGPRFWLEYLNAPGIGTPEVHYHTVYRDKQIDYGTGTQ